MAHVIIRDYVEDILKAPGTNPPKPAMLSKQAFNLYFSNNKRLFNGTLERCGYGYVFARAVGLDQHDVKIHAVFEEMAELMTLLQKILNAKYGMAAKVIDMVSVKIYWTYVDGKAKIVDMVLNEHCDVVYAPDGIVLRANFQEPHTPVAIMTIGDDKYLYFQRYKMDRSGNKYSMGPTKKLWFKQTSGSVFILDQRDEIPTKRHSGSRIEKYFSFWKHSCVLADRKEGVSMSLAFRIGTKFVPVNDDSTLKNPCQTEATTNRFKNAAHLMDDERYIAQAANFTKKLANKFPPFGLNKADYQDWLDAYKIYNEVLIDMRAHGFID